MRTALVAILLVPACITGRAEMETSSCIRHHRTGHTSYFEVGGERVSDDVAMSLLEADSVAGDSARRAEHYKNVGGAIAVSAFVTTLGLIAIGVTRSNERPYLVGAGVAAGGGAAISMPVLWQGENALDHALDLHNTACRR